MEELTEDWELEASDWGWDNESNAIGVLGEKSGGVCDMSIGLLSRWASRNWARCRRLITAISFLLIAVPGLSWLSCPPLRNTGAG